MASFRQRQVVEQAEPLREMASLWAAQVVTDLGLARPDMPADLSDRAADAWEPLIAIADRLGADWAAEARKAAVDLHRSQQRMDDSLVLVLLASIREVFAARDVDRLTSQDLCDRLNALTDVPWNSWSGRGATGIRTGTLGRQLRPFGIVPGSIRLANSSGPGSTAKGYMRSWFEDAWRRYLPEPQDQDVTV